MIKKNIYKKDVNIKYQCIKWKYIKTTKLWKKNSGNSLNSNSTAKTSDVEKEYEDKIINKLNENK